MLYTRLKSAALIVLITGILGGGASLATFTRRAAPPRELPSAERPAVSASKEQSIEIKGRVLDTDGKPVGGAKVYISTYTDKDKSDPKVRSETDRDGRFHFSAHPEEVENREIVVAVAAGYGPDWTPLERRGELALRLVKDDVTIDGRVLDLEGRPLSGVSVRMVRVHKMGGEDLTRWLKGLQERPKKIDGLAEVERIAKRMATSIWGILGASKSIKTEANGRFQLRGFGRDRIVALRIEGPDVEHRTLIVVTRPDIGKGLLWNLYGPKFDHLTAPSKPIRGTVLDKDTSKPIAGVRVSYLPASGGDSAAGVLTDKEGHYELLGVPKSKEYFLSVDDDFSGKGVPIVAFDKKVSDTQGRDPIKVDFAVQRALMLRLRITEKGTGKPVQARVQYAARTDNPNLQRLTTFFSRLRLREQQTEKDGSVSLVVLPGLGFLGICADDEDRFIRAGFQGKKEESGNSVPQRLAFDPLLELFNIVVPINPSADDAKSLVRDIVLDSGQTKSGIVLDNKSQELPGTIVIGQNALTFRGAEQLPTSTFVVTGLDAQHPRLVIFYHAEQKLAQAVVFRGDKNDRPAIRLKPWGAIAGRLVDAKGQPLAGIAVGVRLSDRQMAPLLSSIKRGVMTATMRDVLLASPAVTDKDGRFRLERLIADIHYDLGHLEDRSLFRSLRKDVVGNGATVDLGEIKMNSNPPNKGSKEKP